MTLAHAATDSPVTIWLRTAGSRRQAFYRQGDQRWQPMPVPLADKALRKGEIPSGPMAGTPVVSHETPTDPLATRRAEFATEASAINRATDSFANWSAS